MQGLLLFKWGAARMGARRVLEERDGAGPGALLHCLKYTRTLTHGIGER
jgi:hypothetical protein